MKLPSNIMLRRTGHGKRIFYWRKDGVWNAALLRDVPRRLKRKLRKDNQKVPA